MSSEHFIANETKDIYSRMNTYLTTSDLILAILDVDRVKEHRRMQLLVFLTWKEVFNKESLDPVFLPTTSGIHSELVDHSLSILNTKSLITIDIESYTKRPPLYIYSITKDGKQKIKDKMVSLDVNFKVFRSAISKLHYLSLREILKRIGDRYPYYMSKLDERKSTLNHNRPTADSSLSSRQQKQQQLIRLMKEERNRRKRPSDAKRPSSTYTEGKKEPISKNKRVFGE